MKKLATILFLGLATALWPEPAVELYQQTYDLGEMHAYKRHERIITFLSSGNSAVYIYRIDNSSKVKVKNLVNPIAPEADGKLAVIIEPQSPQKINFDLLMLTNCGDFKIKIKGSVVAQQGLGL